MKTKLMNSGAPAAMRIGLAITLVLSVLVLSLPVPSEASVVVRARVGGVSVGYTDAPRAAGPRVLLQVAPRVLASTAITKHPVVCDLNCNLNGYPGCDRCDDRRPERRVWVPGHYERPRDGRGGRFWVPGHYETVNVGRVETVWIPGHFAKADGRHGPKVWIPGHRQRI